MNEDHLIGEPVRVLRELRALIPPRSLTICDALDVAEAQAKRLLELTYVDEPPFPIELVGLIPRIEVRYRDIPASGLSYWTGEHWLICINRREPRRRQRFTMLHELKHIIDHHAVTRLYGAADSDAGARRAEQAADYFAGCVLMPRSFLETAWNRGERDTQILARRCGTSPQAVGVRLAQLGLSQTSDRQGSSATMAYERSADPCLPFQEDVYDIAS